MKPYITLGNKNMPPDAIQTIEPLDLFDLKFILSASISPISGNVIFSVANVDVKTGLSHTQIWLYDNNDNEPRPFTSGKASDYHPAWSPDGQTIAFLSTRDGSTQIYIKSITDGHEIKITDTGNTILDGPFWSPDGEEIAFTAGPDPSSFPAGYPYRVNRYITKIDGGGNPDLYSQDIFSIDINTRKIKRWTDDPFLNDKPRWSPNGEEILYLASLDPNSHDIHPKARFVNRDQQVVDILPDWGVIHDIQWMPDGKSFVYIGQTNGKPAGSKNDLWVVEKGGIPQCRTKHLFHGVGSGLLSDLPVLWDSPLQPDPLGNFLYYNVQVGGTTRIFQIALRGEESWEPQIYGDAHTVLLDCGRDHLLYTASTMNVPPELFLGDREGRSRLPLTHFNSWLPLTRKLPRIEHFQVETGSGEFVESWLLLPGSHSAPYACIVYIHDGPHAACGHIFNFECQMLAGAGFAVLHVNYNSSSGYGEDFATSVLGKWGTRDYEDIISALDWAVEKGYLDADNIGIFGKADGGRLAAWAITQTSRFKAAVLENPLTDWKSFYGTGDSGVWACEHELGGSPQEIPDVYTKCSPLTFAHQCQTPTLFIVSEDNHHIPPSQALQYYTILKANQCKAEMLILPAASHNASTLGMPIMRYAQNEGLLNWMLQYIQTN